MAAILKQSSNILFRLMSYLFFIQISAYLVWIQMIIEKSIIHSIADKPNDVTDMRKNLQNAHLKYIPYHGNLAWICQNTIISPSQILSSMRYHQRVYHITINQVTEITKIWLIDTTILLSVSDDLYLLWGNEYVVDNDICWINFFYVLWVYGQM